MELLLRVPRSIRLRAKLNLGPRSRDRELCGKRQTRVRAREKPLPARIRAYLFHKFLDPRAELCGGREMKRVAAVREDIQGGVWNLLVLIPPRSFSSEHAGTSL